MDIKYIQLKDAAEKWGVSVRRVQTLCAEGRIPGAKRMGRDWVLPEDAQKPRDGRIRAIREERVDVEDVSMPMPMKTPFLYFTNLYYEPGCANEAIKGLEYNVEAQTIFASELACARGEIDKVYEKANYLLERHSGFYAVLAAGSLLARCAIWRGDLDMWRRAKIHIAGAGARDDRERDIITLSICAMDSMLYDVKDFPDWFKMGSFEFLHKDSLPAAKVYYAKYLYATGHGIASQKIEIDGVKGLALMGLLPLIIEPMISQAIADKTVITEIYLRLTCAVAYHYSKNDNQAILHIDRAIALALPDRLFGILAEYCRTLGSLLEHRIRLVDNDAWEKISGLYINYVNNWSRLNSKVTGRQLVEKLSAQYREVARLAAFKLSDAEIAERMNMSVPGVKQAIRIIKQKSGLERENFAAIL